MKIGILSISDRAHAGTYTDESGPAIRQVLQACLRSEWETVTRLVPGDTERIEATLIELSDHEQCSLILTTGGSGPSIGDITPEITEYVCERILPGFGEAMRRNSQKTTPSAILSRQTAGTRGKTLIINLPDNPSDIERNLDAVLPAIPECLELLGAPGFELKDDSGSAFRT
jgi:molybdopterin adenylyltransferase